MRLSIDISDETHRELKAKAAREGVTISDIVRVAVEKYVRGNFNLGYPQSVRVDAAVDKTVHIPPPVTPRPAPDPPPTPYVRPISKADQVKGKSR